MVFIVKEFKTLLENAYPLHFTTKLIMIYIF